jgi:hypothetical protein
MLRAARIRGKSQLRRRFAAVNVGHRGEQQHVVWLHLTERPIHAGGISYIQLHGSCLSAGTPIASDDFKPIRGRSHRVRPQETSCANNQQSWFVHVVRRPQDRLATGASSHTTS